MQPGGSSHPSGRYGNGNGGGRGQPSRPPPQQLTPQEKEATLLAAGRLAAEYLVARGDLPPHMLENRPPAPIPWRHHRPAPPTIHFQRRPPAPQQHSQFQWELRPYVPPRRQPWPRPFQGGTGPFPKRPRQGAQQRPFPYAARWPSAPPKPGSAGQGSVTASKVEEDDGRGAPAGDTSDSLPTAQPSGVTAGPKQTNQPSSSSLGANESK